MAKEQAEEAQRQALERAVREEKEKQEREEMLARAREHHKEQRAARQGCGGRSGGLRRRSWSFGKPWRRSPWSSARRPRSGNGVGIDAFMAEHHGFSRVFVCLRPVLG